MSFFVLLAPKTPKNQNFEKWKKNLLNIIILQKCVKTYNHVMYISWDIFVILGHFLPFYHPPNNPKNKNFQKILKNAWRYLYIHVYHKWWYDKWFLTFKVWQTEIFVILGHFLPFQPLDNLENQNFENMKKMPEDIIILHICIINDNHMMYGSWDIEGNR